MAQIGGARPELWLMFLADVWDMFVKKPLWGEPYLKFRSLVYLAASVFQDSAMLGRARPSSLHLLLQMCLAGKDPSALESFALEQARARRSRGETAFNFHSYYFLTEADSLQDLPVDSLWLKGEAATALLPVHGKRKSEDKLGERKVSLKTSAEYLAKACIEGLAFGATYGEFVEEMMRQTSRKGWWVAMAAGAGVPPEPPSDVAQQEQEVLSKVALFASRFYPHLLEPLQLSA